MNKILEAREERAEHIKKLMQDNPHKTVVVLKKNVVGTNKNPVHMMFICNYFNEIVLKTFSGKVIEYGKRRSFDGDYCFYVINELGTQVKERTIEIEESCRLGRIIDIDVYHEKSISRRDMSCEMRKCLICDDYAHICARNKTHSPEEILGKIEEIIEEFLTDYLTKLSIQAIYQELELHPKFGLVSHRDTGSHKDMNYQTFINSAFAIRKHISQYIQQGFSKTIDYDKLQKIGISAEKKMFKATNNVNTHKGLVYLLGVFLPALTKTIIRGEDENYLKALIIEISSQIVGDYYDTVKDKNKENLTNADIIYLNHGLKGVRGESLKGLDLIFTIPTYDDFDVDVVNHEYLIQLMSKLDDTTIIHKNNLSTLRDVQNDMKKLIAQGGYKNNKKMFTDISTLYKLNNISPGGSADMLVIKIIYEDLKYLFKNNKGNH